MNLGTRVQIPGSAKDEILRNESNLIPERGQTIAICENDETHTRAANKSKCAPKEIKYSKVVYTTLRKYRNQIIGFQFLVH